MFKYQHTTNKGYFIIGDIIVNYGFEDTPRSGNYTVTFLKAFTTTNYATSAHLYNTSSSAGGYGYQVLNSRKKESCAFVASGNPFSWIAIGY